MKRTLRWSEKNPDFAAFEKPDVLGPSFQAIQDSKQPPAEQPPTKKAKVEGGVE